MLSCKELAVTRAYDIRLSQDTTSTADQATTVQALCLVATFLSYEWQRAPRRWQWDPLWHCQAIKIAIWQEHVAKSEVRFMSFMLVFFMKSEVHMLQTR